jgi:hypothetical protein
MHLRRLWLGVSLGLLLALAFGSPAAAAVLIKDTGTHGDFGTHDDSTDPGAKCGYSAANANGVAFLRWIKVYPVFAGTSSGVSQQPVKWTVIIQRSPDNGTTWKNLISQSQTRTAKASSGAAFGAMKVAFTGNAKNDYRAISKLQWIRNGHVTGTTKLRMEFYSVKWTVGSPDFVFEDYCTGPAD